MIKQQNKFGNWLKTSITARMLMIGFLILILLVPLSYTKSLINERSLRQKSVVNEISDKWGAEVELYGPILKIPYKTYSEKIIRSPLANSTETIEHVHNAYFFPKKLDITTTINPEEKKRGIYKTSVYKSDISIDGSFEIPNFSIEDIDREDIIWEKATIIIQSSNLKGINNQVKITLNDKEYPFVPKFKNKNTDPFGSTLNQLETSKLDPSVLPKDNQVNFKVKLKISGSKQITIIPIGKETDLNIKSNWQTANFIGNYLPLNSNKISEDGFDAKWKVQHINRAFPQENFKTLPDLTDFSFGVNFMIPVDEYQKSERTTKYGFLVIALTFLIFFLIQTISSINIHPFQYLMIGLALIMFYTLLISISEHSNYKNAYLIAGISVITLITFYSKSIMKSNKFPFFIGLSLSTLYLFIYIIIQLENYALLVGSLGLFVILSSVMYVSRKIDWN